ncbi:MAG: prepilin-type N-terminal cleavage/methylation domain-containing protein [Erysipelotrichaceae bacterium]|nr:prepilin-type N-terminal cleavage/methylation domain-containing protein [Erysipelotrichaceae bacterium]
MIKNKLNRNGFSLAELLLAIAIMLLATAIVAAGIPAAANAYRKVVDVANAQLLLTTTATCLRDELDMATDVNIDKSGNTTTIDYYDANGWYCVLESTVDGDDAQSISVTKNYGPSESETMLLVSDSAASKKFVVAFSGASKTDDVVTFNNIKVYKKNSSDTTTVIPDVELEEYKVRMIMKTAGGSDE